jgi:hypothetical protein
MGKTDMPEQMEALANQSKMIYAHAWKYTNELAKPLREHFMVLVGVLMYIAFLVMANVFYSPSYYACLGKNGSVWSLTNSLVHAVFIVFLIFYVIQGLLFPKGSTKKGPYHDFAKSFGEIVPYGLCLCMLFLFVSYGILFFSCQNPINCKDCTPAQKSTFTDLVTKQVNRSTASIEQLYDYYNREMGTRVPIAACENYYNGKYRAVGGDESMSCGQTTATQLPPCMIGPVMGPTKDDRSIGTTARDAGPTLGQFYIMTSSRTCVVSDQYDGYMSAAMIRVALRAGARCLDFDLTNYEHGKTSFPIVTICRDRDNRNLQRNFVRFEDVLKTIVDEWIHKWPHGTMPRDPLFLHLNLRRGLTTDCMNQIAYLLQYYLNELESPGFLLPPGFHYQQMQTFPKCLSNVNLCTLFNRIVILVHSPFRAPSPLLDGLINCLVGKSMHANIDTGDAHYSFKEIEWKSLREQKWEKIVEQTKRSLMYVSTSFHPYSDISEKLTATEGGLTTDLNAKYHSSDAMTDLLMNKQSINNDPIPAFHGGCQFMAMNLQTLDPDLKAYLSVFKKTSFVLKPQNMWVKVKTQHVPKPQTSCNQDDQPMRKVVEDRCYEVCVPDKEYKTKSSTLTGLGLTPIKVINDTCRAYYKQKGDKYVALGPSSITDPTLIRDIGLSGDDADLFDYQALDPTTGKMVPAQFVVNKYTKYKN